MANMKETETYATSNGVCSKVNEACGVNGVVTESTKLSEIEKGTNYFDTIEEAIEVFRKGDMIVVVDDEDRENEGDLIMAAQFMTKEKMNFIIRNTSGVVVVPMTGKRIDELNLPPMVPNNTERHQTAFTHSVDLIKGTSTGISASDRTKTACALADPNSVAEDFARPGHMFPLRAKDGGVLERMGHTEAAVDFCKLAGLEPVGVICEIVNEDGDMSRRDDLKVFATKHNLKFVTIKALIEYRTEAEK
eukprot:Nk52_evm11s281 gene=Nk52_evmTU11s281